MPLPDVVLSAMEMPLPDVVLSAMEIPLPEEVKCYGNTPTWCSSKC